MRKKIEQIMNKVESGDLAYHDAVDELLILYNVSGQSEQLHLCPVCNEMAGKSYLLSKLPTICQKCDHAWNRA